MPKAILSNDKGLVQSSGNGLRITPKNSNGSGLHFKTMEFDLGETGYVRQANDDFVAYLKIGNTAQTLPAQSIVLGVSAVVTEKSNLNTADFSVSLIASTSASANDNITGEVDLLAGITAGDGATLNKAFGSFKTTGVAVGATKTSLCILEANGSNTAGTHTSGKIVVTVVYSGVES